MITPDQAERISKIVFETEENPFILFVMDETGIRSVSNVSPEHRNEFIKDLFVALLGHNPDSTTRIPIANQ